MGEGGFVFFDATYAELSLGFFGGRYYNSMEQISLMGLDINLLGKYPLAFNDDFTGFFCLGVSYRIMFPAKDEDGAPAYFSAVGFNWGFGTDFFFTHRMYLRAEFLTGLQFPNELVDAKQSIYVKTSVGFEIDIKLAVGYSFF